MQQLKKHLEDRCKFVCLFRNCEFCCSFVRWILEHGWSQGAMNFWLGQVLVFLHLSVFLSGTFVHLLCYCSCICVQFCRMVAMEWVEQGGWDPKGRRVQESLGVLRGPRWFNINIIDFDRGSNMCVHTTQHGGCNCTVATQKRKQIPAAEDDHHILVHICGEIFT